MLKDTLLRPDVVFPTAHETCLYTFDLAEPYWRTTAVAYDLLESFMDAFPLFEHINMAFVRHFLWSSQLPDLNERRAIQDVLIRYFQNHPSHHPDFLRALTARLISLGQDLMVPLSGAPLLGVAACIVPLASSRHPAEVERLLMAGVLPLLSSNWFTVFAAAWTDLICDDVVKAVPDFAAAVLAEMKRHWPRTAAEKQVAFARVLVALAPLLGEELGAQLPLVMDFLKRLLQGTNFLALKFLLPAFDGAEWRAILARLTRAQRQELGEVLLTIATTHWDANIQAAAQVLQMRYPAEAKAGDRTGRATGRVGVPVAAQGSTDVFYEAWRAILKQGARECPGIDRVAFMRTLAAFALQAGEGQRDVIKLRANRRISDGTQSMLVFSAVRSNS
jgi:hypothetical protein